jgi:hypothetical protein
VDFIEKSAVVYSVMLRDTGSAKFLSQNWGYLKCPLEAHTGPRLPKPDFAPVGLQKTAKGWGVALGFD